MNLGMIIKAIKKGIDEHADQSAQNHEISTECTFELTFDSLLADILEELGRLGELDGGYGIMEVSADDITKIERLLEDAAGEYSEETLYIKHFLTIISRIGQMLAKLPPLHVFLLSGGDAPHHMFDTAAIEQR